MLKTCRTSLILFLFVLATGAAARIVHSHCWIQSGKLRLSCVPRKVSRSNIELDLRNEFICRSFLLVDLRAVRNINSVHIWVTQTSRNLFCQLEQCFHYFSVAIYAIRSARSCSFLRPAKTIFVPTRYFFGLMRNWNMCFSLQVIPDFLIASL